MADNSVAVFRPKARSLIRPALFASVALMAGIVGTLLREPTPGSSFPWIRFALITGTGFIALATIFFGGRFLLARRQVLTIMPSGLQGPDAAGHSAFCGWDNVVDAQVVDGGQESHLLIKGRYLATPLKIPVSVFEDPRAAVLIERYAGDSHLLNEALRRAGA